MYPEEGISDHGRNTPTFFSVFLQGATTAPSTPKFHRPLHSASVDIGIDFLCRTTNKNVSRMAYKEVAQALPLPYKSVVFGIYTQAPPLPWWSVGGPGWKGTFHPGHKRAETCRGVVIQ
jgi:hypothetical protein